MMHALVEAALRALIMALAVWAGLRIFRVSNVVAQKAAWGLVLVCGAAVPLVMRWQILPASMALKVPAIPRVMRLRTLPEQTAAPVHAETDAVAAPKSLVVVAAEKPRAGKRLDTDEGSAFRANSAELTRALSTLPVEDKSAESAPIAALQADAVTKPAQSGVEPLSGEMKSWAVMALESARDGAWLLYLAVCAVLLIRLAYGLNQALELWQSAEIFVPYPQDDPGYGLRMRFSRAVSSPVTIGNGVLLPYECLEWDAEKLRIVLAHERAHIRQADFYLQLLAGLYSAVFWFSPLGWWLKRKLCDLGEAISDHAGLEEAASGASYAQLLLEFAALPRPTQIDMTRIGVAMARNTNLSQRIERLLNESRFRQGFAGSRRRLVLAVLLVTVALFAGTTAIRVEAASGQQATPPVPPAAAPSPAAAPAAVPSAPGPAAQPASPAPVQEASPDTPPPAAVAPVAPVAEMPPMPAPDIVPDVQAEPVMPPMPPANYGDIHVTVDTAARALAYARAAARYAQDSAAANASMSHSHITSDGRGYSYSYSNRDGDTIAIVSGNGNVSGSGEFGNHFDEVRKQVHGDFLYYEHDGKSYVIDDPALVAKAKALYAPIDELGRQQAALGKKQEELGRQQEELGRKQEQASVPTPDISKEMAELNAAVAKLNAKKGSTVTEDDLSDIESKIGDIQGRLGELQGKMGERMGQLGDMQGRLGEEQGKLGEAQGRLGEQQGKLAEDADRKLKLMFQEELHNGKARQIQ